MDVPPRQVYCPLTMVYSLDEPASDVARLQAVFVGGSLTDRPSVYCRCSEIPLYSSGKDIAELDSRMLDSKGLIEHERCGLA